MCMGMKVDLQSVEVSISPIPITERMVLANLMQLYCYDLSEFNDDVINESGLFAEYPYFDAYWTESERFPFFIRLSLQRVGFALVRELAVNQYAIAEFFVARKYRRLGVGKQAALQLFQRFPAEWHIAQQAANIPSQQFWRTVIAEYTNGSYQEVFNESQPKGPKQIFNGT